MKSHRKSTKRWQELRDRTLDPSPDYLKQPCAWCEEAERKAEAERRNGARLIAEVEEFLRGAP